MEIDADYINKGCIFLYNYAVDDEEEIETHLLKSYAIINGKRVEFFSRQIMNFAYDEKELHTNIQKYFKKTQKLANFT